MGGDREITDSEATRWGVSVISHGRTSGYLNPKVHRAVLQFTCRTRATAPRYCPLPVEVPGIDALSDGQLLALLGHAKTH